MASASPLHSEQPLSGPVHHIVGADVDRDQCLAFNQNVKCDPITQVDRNGMQSLKATS